MISVSPPGQEERKARDLNPHGLAAARFSKPARQPVSGYPPEAVDPAGIEPALPACRAGVVPLDHRPVQSVETTGVELVAGCLRSTLAPSEHASPTSSQRSSRESNPDRRLTKAVCCPNTSRPASCGGRI
jgi:hypothetical protein